MTSAGVIAVPSCHFASGRSSYSTQERSSGISMVRHSRQYWLNGSSADDVVRLS